MAEPDPLDRPPGDFRRLAVLGSPIAHSKSPALHAAAYRVLGLDWEYAAVEVTTTTLPGFLGGLDSSWRGLSLTMPLKRDVVPLLTTTDELVELTGAANTVRIEPGVLAGFNTDVYGIEESFRRAGVAALHSVAILGGGATAASALVAASQMGATAATIALRDPAKGGALRTLADRLGVHLQVQAIGSPLPPCDAVVSTLPNGAEARPMVPEHVRRSAVLLDVAYEPWPTPLAASWTGPVIPGIEMLVHQAVAQVRVFLQGSPDRSLPGDDRVLTAMRSAVGLT
ncbi:shikimate dehydrogenase family protein [Lysobacter korlensis]|uniref:Shikimate dehydrogenase family protein n=1 Tax=Lysobacter korlensis TaxID=553636 RepID=A0ABV6RNR6_9GAMM